MPFTVVHAAQSAGSSANSSVAVVATPTAGNILVTMFSQVGVNTPTASGYTVNATKAVYNTSAASVWVGYKIATGSETTAAWTVGSGGTAEGVCYWEIAGGPATITLDGVAVHTDNIASSGTGSLSVTTTVAGSIVLIGEGASVSSGTISAWTGTNVATNIGTIAARCFGGSFITTSTISTSFTANWSTSRVSGMIAISIQPAGGSNKAVAPATITGTSTLGGNIQKLAAVKPASITGASSMASAVNALKKATPASVTGTSTMSGSVHSFDPAVPASILGTSTLAVALVFRRALGAALISGTSVLGGTVSGGSGGAGHRHLAPSIELTIAPSIAPVIAGRNPS